MMSGKICQNNKESLIELLTLYAEANIIDDWLLVFERLGQVISLLFSFLYQHRLSRGNIQIESYY